MLSKVGFFHFGRDHGAPIESVRSALSEHTKECLVGSLIVLPEAFNIATDYWDWEKKAEPDSSVKDALEADARGFKVVFVVGLVDPDERGAAYLIDGHDPPKLICCKVTDDKSGRYEPCTDSDVATNPVSYEGSCVAALICHDASNGRYRRLALMRRVDACASASKILCIPACNTRTPPDQFRQDSKNKTLVMANSHNKFGSFIMRDGLPMSSCNDEANRICLVGLPKV